MKNNKEKRIISKIFTRLFFTYEKDIVVMENIKEQSVSFYFSIKNFYANGKSRKTKRFILYSKSSKKLYSSNYLNEVLHYIKMLQFHKYIKEIKTDD